LWLGGEACFFKKRFTPFFLPAILLHKLPLDTTTTTYAMPLYTLRFENEADVRRYVEAIGTAMVLPTSNLPVNVVFLEATALLRWSFAADAQASATTPTTVCVHGFDALKAHPQVASGELGAFAHNLEWAHACPNRNLSVYLLQPADFHLDIGCGGLRFAVPAAALAPITPL